MQCEYAAALGLRREINHMRAHFAVRTAVERRLRNIDSFAQYIRGRVLDWGCNHSIDSCIYRRRFGDAVELHGCDTIPPHVYRPIHETAGLQYAMLTDPVRLPYPNDFFDVAVSDGVLEHVPDDLASLREVRRVLKPGGVFIITFLPNAYSYTEAFARWVCKRGHSRLYRLGRTKRMLRSESFQIVEARYFLMIPTMVQGLPQRLRTVYARLGWLTWTLNAALERAWPLNRLASNLLIIARKQQ